MFTMLWAGLFTEVLTLPSGQAPDVGSAALDGPISNSENQGSNDRRGSAGDLSKIC
jgi:hypothetical protein